MTHLSWMALHNMVHSFIELDKAVVHVITNLPLGLRGKAGGCARVTAGPKRPHLGVCPGPNIPLQGRQGSRGCIPGSPGESGLASRGSKGLRSPLEPRRGSLGAP